MTRVTDPPDDDGAGCMRVCMRVCRRKTAVNHWSEVGRLMLSWSYVVLYTVC